ncbi:hypothetical protein L873DRAFT_873707 [Choiromyces venosus 120613-1]|uniref:Hydrophobin n=1 Tax=Choiromyces venosus 120613-1 TaxID=1336337 RepID=A0A3N4JR04_9PEZI|nr:hypothetical protein L873DRAFT_873599 [Choiromyces venosus 120613-1]RPA99697.1 hypothetical protein L873DRAFT_873707 [Choiromyces venosus 120613-1]
MPFPPSPMLSHPHQFNQSLLTTPLQLQSPTTFTSKPLQTSPQIHQNGLHQVPRRPRFAAAAAVNAAPAAQDEKNVNVQDNSKRCEKQYQTMFCCSDFTNTKATGIFTGVLNNIAVKCNTVPVNVIAGR